MAGMRDVLIHDYINVKIDIVWKTVVDYLPPLLELTQQHHPERRLGAVIAAGYRTQKWSQKILPTGF